MRPSKRSKPDLFPDDILLRDRGFQIYLRPANREAIWIRDGVYFRQADAVAKARQEHKVQLELLQKAHS